MVVISFLKQHVPTFNIKTWQTFYCLVCAKAKSTHQLARARTDIPKQKPLDLLVSDILGPFEEDVQGFWYLLTIRDHVPTYKIVYPLKLWSDAPAAILDAIKQLKVCTGLTPKALRTNNAQEFTLASFTNSLGALRVTFCPLLPYLPQENGEAERLNRTLADMARAIVVQGQMPSCFWQFAYASASYIHNRILNSHCPKSSPHQELFGQAPSIATLYPHGANAVVHIPAVHQRGKLNPQAIDYKLLRPLMSGGWLLWDQHTNKMVQSVSVIFPQFQTSRQADTPTKGSLMHIMNAMLLGKVPTEQYFEEENRAIASLPLVKDVKIPNHLGQALSGPHRDHWRAGPDGKEGRVGCYGERAGHWWVFDLKTNTDGGIAKFKAQLVACGDKQSPGVYCSETYALTASLMLLHLMLATAVFNGWQVASFDVSGAYLYSPVEECVLVEPPTYFMPELRSKVLSLKKALYGMRQAGRCWWKFLLGILHRLGFVAMEVDQSLYIFCSKNVVIAIWIHIDNGVITSTLVDATSDFKAVLVSQLDIKWSKNFDRIVGLECVFGNGEVAITQWQLTDSILEAYPWQIVARDSPFPVLPVGVPTSNASPVDTAPFRSVIGSLAYLVSGSRPDLAFVVNYLAHHSMGPTPALWDLLDHMVCYLPKTCDRGIHLCPGNISLNLWSNAGWGGDLECSQMGFVLRLGNTPILWGSKRQSVVALSTCAAEYITLSDSTQHLVQAINQLGQLVSDFNKAIFCDNQAAVQVLIDNKLHKQMRYLDRAFFFVNDTVRKHGIKITWVKTDDMLANALTKRLLGPTLLTLPFLGVSG
ncbi:hypothetical protein O181_022698 [Austropuccinia psidii MF-1]|uniref:Integrase catalytic domain-containing protein n=1 Tax=Austropuccinia psidii MF-1 TaxID=1389203 RepID=A0A9Q3CHE3_9BASI|nr:hypothetical protein [Austropuccinia psidii MF-1]